MIVDLISSLPRYESVLPGSTDAFQRVAQLTALPTGRHEMGNGNYFSLTDETPKPHEPKLEAHRKYVDIQIALTGSFDIGWAPLSRCVAPLGDYLPDRDVQFFDDRSLSMTTMIPGFFIMLFPEDAHEPRLPTAPMRKVVFKIQTPR